MAVQAAQDVQDTFHFHLNYFFALLPLLGSAGSAGVCARYVGANMAHCAQSKQQPFTLGTPILVLSPPFLSALLPSLVDAVASRWHR